MKRLSAESMMGTVVPRIIFIIIIIITVATAVLFMFGFQGNRLSEVGWLGNVVRRSNGDASCGKLEGGM